MLRDYVKMSQPSQTSATRERMLRKHKLKADQLVGIVRHSGGIQDFWREDCVGSMSCLGLKYAVGMLPQIHVAMQQRGAAMWADPAKIAETVTGGKEATIPRLDGTGS